MASGPRHGAWHGAIHGIVHNQLMYGGIVAATPTHQATGAKAEGTGDVTVNWPAHAADDVALLFVESNGGEPAVLGTPAGFVEVTGSPQIDDTGGNTTRLTVFWCRATGAAMTSPVITDPGNHCEAVIVTYRGCRTFDDPVCAAAGGTTAGVPSAAITVPGANSGAPNCRIVIAVANGGGWDASGYTNANLTDITERFDDFTGLGSAGGLSIADGAYAGPGDWGNTTLTMGAAQTCAYMAIALTGSSGSGEAGESVALTSLGTAITAARVWSTGVTDDDQFIIQAYNYPDDKPTEWFVFDLVAGTSTKTEGTNGIFSNSNFQCGGTFPRFSDADGYNQLRASNGRIFFPMRGLNWAYFDPTDDLIHELPGIPDPGNTHAIIFSATFGADGLIYASTQADSGTGTLPAVVSLDPVTLDTQLLGHVGSVGDLVYGYYTVAEADGSKVYVATGQNPWELWSLDTATGVSTLLDPGDGPYTHIEFNQAAESWKVRFGNAGGSDDFWLADGVLYPAAVGFTTRDVTPAGPVATVAAPEVDWSDAGLGIIRWRPRGDVGAFTEIEFEPTQAPVNIDAMVELPDEDIFMAGAAYTGFSRYDGAYAGLAGAIVSQPVFAEAGDWFCGYPNGALYSYDPAMAWDIGVNPVSMGSYGSATDMKYPYFLSLYSNRLYCLGRRERSGVGSALGYFDTVGETFDGHHDAPLDNYTPRGMLVLGADNMVLVSGETLDDSPAKILVYDLDLVLQDELTVNADTNTGLLFHDSGTIIVGVTDTGAYRYDLSTETVLSSIGLGGAVTAATQHADGTILVAAGTKLMTINPTTLATEDLVVGIFLDDQITNLSWIGDRMYAVAGPTLYEVG